MTRCQCLRPFDHVSGSALGALRGCFSRPGKREETGTMIPYPNWLSSGDNAWQLIAATLVGLMSIPGIAVLYAGIVQRKWAVNTMLMAFTGFSLVLVVWVLWGFKMGFGEPMKLGPGILRAAVGIPHTILSSNNQQQAVIPLLDGAMPK